jgi:regulator of replication initiation timing
MKSIIAERNMFENQVEDVKAEVNKLKKENTDIQMRYHELKLRLSKKKESLAEMDKQIKV